MLKLVSLDSTGTHCTAHGAGLLHPDALHHLEDVHRRLVLALLNGRPQSNEEGTAPHGVPEWGDQSHQ